MEAPLIQAELTSLNHEPEEVRVGRERTVSRARIPMRFELIATRVDVETALKHVTRLEAVLIEPMTVQTSRASEAELALARSMLQSQQTSETGNCG